MCCILFRFYIKPQHDLKKDVLAFGCILFHFYIKPQLLAAYLIAFSVVSYSISTSNHNVRA